MLMYVVMRKNIQIFNEVAALLVDFVSVLTSTVQFSGLLFRRTTTRVSSRYSSPMSSMIARHDRWSAIYVTHSSMFLVVPYVNAFVENFGYVIINYKSQKWLLFYFFWNKSCQICVLFFWIRFLEFYYFTIRSRIEYKFWIRKTFGKLHKFGISSF